MLSQYNATARQKFETKYGKSKIQRYLKSEIDFLLAPSANQLNNVSFDDIYIPVEDAQIFLQTALHKSNIDKILYFTGLTGSGKSMILKKVFSINGMTSKIIDNNLIIPFSFDNLLNGISSSNKDTSKIEKSIEQMFVNMLSDACEELENNIVGLKIANENIEDYYKHLKKSRGDYSQYKNGFLKISTEERINNLYSENPIAYFTSILKYYLNQDNCPVNNIVIIIDDIEGVGEQCELFPVKVAYRIITCFENQVKGKSWSTHVIISCRHYVYRLIDKKYSFERQQIEAYTESEIFNIEDAPPLYDIIEKRYDAIYKKDKNAKWVIALSIVSTILKRIDNTIGEFILNLNIRNVRKALSTLKTMIYNKQWIERDYYEEVPGAFTISTINEYNLTPATLIRAIGMEESLIYFSDDSKIPNVLFNKDEMDLYLLLIIKYCINNMNSTYSNWRNSINLDAFYQKIQFVFENDSEKKYFVLATRYLILNRLLLRSIDQLQNDTKPVDEESVQLINSVYIANSAVDIWNLLEKNSVLFEMYIDDIWTDNTTRNMTKHQYRGFDTENYNAALLYMNTLINKESSLRKKAYNLGKIEEYYNLFGKDSVSNHLLEGLENSLNNFYKNDANEQSEYSMISNLAKRIKIEIDNIK